MAVDFLQNFFKPFASGESSFQFPAPAPSTSAPRRTQATGTRKAPQIPQAQPLPFEGQLGGGGFGGFSFDNIFGSNQFQFPGASPPPPVTPTAARTGGPAPAAPFVGAAAAQVPQAGGFQITPQERAALTNRGGQTTSDALFNAGISRERIRELMDRGVIAKAPSAFDPPTTERREVPPTGPFADSGAPSQGELLTNQPDTIRDFAPFEDVKRPEDMTPEEIREAMILRKGATGEDAAEDGTGAPNTFQDFLKQLEGLTPEADGESVFNVNDYVAEQKEQMETELENITNEYEGAGGLFDQTRRQQGNLKGSMLAALIKAGVPKSSSTYQSALQGHDRREAQAIDRDRRSMAAKLQAAKTGKENLISQTLATEQARQDTLAQQGISNTISFGNMFSQFARDQLTQQLADATTAQGLSDAEAKVAQDWLKGILDDIPNMDDPGVAEAVRSKAQSYGLDPDILETRIRTKFHFKTAATARGGSGGGAGARMFDAQGSPTSKYWTLSTDEKNIALAQLLAQDMERVGGDLTLDDRKAYKAKIERYGGDWDSAPIESVVKQYAPLSPFWLLGAGTKGKG